MAQILVRPAAFGDRASLYEAALSSWYDANAEVLSRPEVTAAPDMIARALDERLERMRVALDEARPGQVLGYYSLGDGPKEQDYLWHLYVRPEAQRAGVGTALHGAAVRELKDRGVSRARLDVLEDNMKGRAFWRAMGWNEIGRDTSEAYALILMERDLA